MLFLMSQILIDSSLDAKYLRKRIPETKNSLSDENTQSQTHPLCPVNSFSILKVSVFQIRMLRSADVVAKNLDNNRQNTFHLDCTNT